MTDLSFPRPERDYLGRKVCDSCWNSRHWHRDKEIKEVIWECLGGDCECQCRALFKDQTARRKRVKPDYSQQAVIDTGDDVLEFGKRERSEHEDRG